MGKGGKGLCIASLGNFPAAGKIQVKDPDQFEFRKAGSDPGMDGPQVADSNDTKRYCGHDQPFCLHIIPAGKQVYV
jgi:hypothetical protein